MLRQKSDNVNIFLSRLRPFFDLAVEEVQRRGERGKVACKNSIGQLTRNFNCYVSLNVIKLIFKNTNICVLPKDKYVFIKHFIHYPIPINASSINDNINSSQPQTAAHLIKMQLFICPKDWI
ncbi:hypothetical protein Mgra_00007708 [Meloidogyne graminicola]|uniref:Uncharacterized protein n=1 Tax=Meloidogyne graminicola TaxID=189291 RepID=A0A8S9ZI30_9BILA|nr:hypothetical protein Mgra_00007708 [Meloidogyne graminicola]